MNNQHVTLFVLLDLSEAFDTVDHGILLEALNNSSWNLEAECLSGFDLIFQGAVNGYRFVVVSLRVLTRTAEFLKVPFLDHSLFTIHTSSLRDVVQDYLPSIHCYGDDNQIYVSFSSADETGHPDAIAAFEGYIQVIRNWMHVW